MRSLRYFLNSEYQKAYKIGLAKELTEDRNIDNKMLMMFASSKWRIFLMMT
jgi:hypothetical protein